MGIISLLRLMWSRALNAVRPPVRELMVYSEDTNKVDDKGGPYIVRIRDE